MTTDRLCGVLTALMNALAVVAFVLTIGLVVAFSGRLAATSLGALSARITDLLTIPFGFMPIHTPYGGVFDVDGALSVLVALFAEWLLTRVRARIISTCA